MSFDKVEVRVFSGPDQVQVGSNTEPDLIVMNIGPKGDTGATGNTGATGPAGPNSVTSATTSDGTANLSLGDLEVVGGEIYTDGEYSHIYTQGDGAEIFTIGTDAIIYTQGADAHISTSGDSATIYTSGASGSIYTTGANAGISTVGANATMGTQGTNATISTAGSAAHIQTSHASAAVKSTNFAAVESGGASLVDGSMQPCLTWSAGGRNLTIPSGTATTFNTTSYTFGTGAASAFVTALGTFNSSTATALQNSRNIFGIAFNGTANVVGDATNTGHFASIPTGGQAGHFITLNGTAPTVIAGRSAWWSDGSGNPSFRNGTGTAVTLVKSSDLGTNVANFLATPTSANLASALTDENGTGGGFVRAEGATLTSPTLVGTPVFNATAYTYGTGAAAAHRTALELGTLATQNGTFSDKANIAGGNSFTGAQSIATTGATAALALSTTSTSSAIVLETALAASATGTTSIAIGRALTTNNAAIFGHGASYAYAHVQGRTAADFNVQSSGNVCIGTVTDNNSFGGAKLQVRGQGSSTATWRGRIVAGGDNAVFLMGEYNSGAWLGAHNGALSAWADMYIQAQGGKDLCIAYDGASFYTNSRIITGATLAMGTASPNSRALIDMTSTTKGFLPPRMTLVQRNAIASPPAGLMIYNTTSNKLDVYNGTAWEVITSL
jgi:hypothetical protein